MQTVVLSLGGSLLAPNGINWEYLKQFCAFIQIHNDIRWIITVGGGKPVRELIAHVDDRTQKDLVGIAMTRVHAQLLISQLEGAHPHVLTSTELPDQSTVYVAGGFTPGRTTDDVATQFAVAHNASHIINLTNVDGVLVGGAVQEHMTFDAFLELFSEHEPGMNAPFDPVATRRAQQAGMNVYIISGKHLERIDAILSEKPFIGTLLSRVDDRLVSNDN